MKTDAKKPNKNVPGANRPRGLGSGSKRLADGSVKYYIRAWRGRGAPVVAEGVGITLELARAAAYAALGEAGGDERLAHALTRSRAARDAELSIAKGRLDDIVCLAVRNARTRARTRGIPFDISETYVSNLLAEQQWCCALMGIRFRHGRQSEGASRAPLRPSLDRITASGGYIEGNVRLVLVAVNVALNEWGEDLFREIATGLLMHRR